jgi:hypothetical protein
MPSVVSVFVRFRAPLQLELEKLCFCVLFLSKTTPVVADWSPNECLLPAD